MDITSYQSKQLSTHSDFSGTAHCQNVNFINSLTSKTAKLQLPVQKFPIIKKIPP